MNFHTWHELAGFAPVRYYSTADTPNLVRVLHGKCTYEKDIPPAHCPPVVWTPRPAQKYSSREEAGRTAYNLSETHHRRATQRQRNRNHDNHNHESRQASSNNSRGKFYPYKNASASNKPPYIIIGDVRQRNAPHAAGHPKSTPQLAKSASMRNIADVVNGWVSPSRYPKTELKRTKRYAHCHFAHSSR